MKIGKGTILAMLLVCIAMVILVMPVQAYTTEVHVVKYASDETTILNETNVTYQWMRDNLPIMDEGNLYGTTYTHHYFQGPTFDLGNLWDPPESVNVDSRDYGAVAGTDVKDLCELVGGMSPGDRVKIKSPDGFYKWFDYAVAYNDHGNETLDSRQGPMVLAWYNGEESITGEHQGVGYPDTGYTVGMRLHFFADTSTNPWGYHAFGLWDMHECMDEQYWHYYYDGTLWPSSSGLSVKWVGSILIYSNESPQGLLGDVNNDGVVNVLDATKVKNRAGNPFYPLDNEWAADVNSDGIINVLDATKVKNRAADPNYPW
ncbi:MAG: dockerin type I repeat-containing protein [Methanocellales archaeon]|nr:dockerin type I repeat-containing protein [Methanocellales archaeon]MDD3292314.1 dockerin type I repeat-containing protein [Methanocellales archaeon]MDD5485778.1 dockerin type I repeat-containing protein [Methanocellales archaeon]